MIILSYVEISIIFIFLSLFVCIDGRTIGNSCIISIDYKYGTMIEPSPLLLSQNSTFVDFYYPNKQGIIELEQFKKLYLACPGRRNHFEGIKSIRNFNEMEVKCIGENTFIVDCDIFNLSDVKCKYLPVNEALRTGKRCYNGTIIQVGFPLNNFFFTNFEICRNEEAQWTHYAKSYITNKISHFQRSYPRPRNWLAGDFYKNFDVDHFYKISTQLQMISILVGSVELANKYVNYTASRFMARGHLSPKADYVYGNAQRSTFWYINAAPQWQSFNAGNWRILELNVRELADKRSLNLIVYTGIHGQMTLTDINGNQVPIWLFVNGTHKALAVPKFFWKIIYDPVTKTGTAFVGLNDPYAHRIDDDVFICKNIADRIQWLTWKPTSITRGVSYACRINDLRRRIKSIPNLDVRGMLI